MRVWGKVFILFLGLIVSVSLQGQDGPRFVHLSQIHQVGDKFGERGFFSDQDVVISQFEIIKTLSRKPKSGSYAVFKEGLLRDLTEEDRAGYAAWVKEVFPNGLPSDPEELSEPQREFLARFGGTNTAFALGYIDNVYATSTPADEERFDKAIKEAKSSEEKNDLIFKQREDLALSMMKKKMAQPEMEGKIAVVVYGADHDFSDNAQALGLSARRLDPLPWQKKAWPYKSWHSFSYETPALERLQYFDKLAAHEDINVKYFATMESGAYLEFLRYQGEAVALDASSGLSEKTLSAVKLHNQFVEQDRAEVPKPESFASGEEAIQSYSQFKPKNNGQRYLVARYESEVAQKLTSGGKNLSAELWKNFSSPILKTALLDGDHLDLKSLGAGGLSIQEFESALQTPDTADEIDREQYEKLQEAARVWAGRNGIKLSLSSGESLNVAVSDMLQSVPKDTIPEICE